MNITHKGQTYGLCFENDYIDIFLFELGYELEDLRLPYEFEKDEEGNFVLNEKDQPIPIVNKEAIKKLSHFVYAFAKAHFINQKENDGFDFPLTQANLLGIVLGFTPEQSSKITLNLFKSLSPNLTTAQIKAMDELADKDTVKKKSLGQKLKPVPIAKLD